MFFHNDQFKTLLKDKNTITGEHIAEGHGRFYHLGDDKVYPSVTTILSNTKDKKFLEVWKARIGEYQAKMELEQANERGTELHTAVEKFVNNVPIGKIFVSHPTVIPNLTDLKSVLSKNITQVYFQECPLFSDKYRLAGRIDCVADWNGVPAIVDFKTSKKPKVEEWIQDYYLQTLAYKLMWEEHFPLKIERTVIVIATDYGFPQVFVEDNPMSRMDELETRIKQYYYEHSIKS